MSAELIGLGTLAIEVACVLEFKFNRSNSLSVPYVHEICGDEQIAEGDAVSLGDLGDSLCVQQGRAPQHDRALSRPDPA